jgi:hypothetical protein
MTDYKFPTDIEFRKKAAFIADKVLYAINVAKLKLDPLDSCGDCYCPLGCLNLEKHAPQPNAPLASLISNYIITESDARAFIVGYDSIQCTYYRADYDAPMYQLGLAYRKRFSK